MKKYVFLILVLFSCSWKPNEFAVNSEGIKDVEIVFLGTEEKIVISNQEDIIDIVENKLNGSQYVQGKFGSHYQVKINYYSDTSITINFNGNYLRHKRIVYKMDSNIEDWPCLPDDSPTCIHSFIRDSL